MTVLAERIKIDKDAAFEHLHPRNEHGEFSVIGAALHALAHDLGEVISHEELGAPGHEHSSHAVVSLHADGEAALHAVNEDGTVSILADGLTDDDLQGLSYAINDALQADLPEGGGFHSEDVAQVAGIRVTRGRTQDGVLFVALDTDDEGVTLIDEHAVDAVNQMEGLADRSSRYDPESLYNRAPLPPEETLVKRKILAGESDNELFLALVDTSEGRRVRLGLGGGEDDGISDFTGGRGDLVASLDEATAQRLDNEIDDIWTQGDALEGRISDADKDFLAWQKTPEGARLADLEAKERLAPRPDSPISNRIYRRTGPSLTESEQAEYDRLTAAGQSFYGALPDEGDNFTEPREIAGPWGSGTIVVRGVSTGDGFQMQVSVTPPGWSTADWERHLDQEGTDLPSAVFGRDTADQVEKLQGLLRDAFADPGQPMAKSARAVATGNERNAARLKRYWTRGEGLAKWVRSAHPWSTLRRHLAEYIKDPGKLDRTTSAWFHSATGIWSGSRKGKNPVGPG